MYVIVYLVPQVTAQTIINTYNDLPFSRIEKWIAGICYFGYLVGRNILKDSPRDNISISNE